MAEKKYSIQNLPKSRYSREVNHPISLGMEPVRAFVSNAFGD